MFALTLQAVGATALWGATLPTPPLEFDTTYPTSLTGVVINVNTGDNLQAAIDSARAGDTLVLQAGATFTGPFNFPDKAGNGWIHLRSSAYSNLPAPGNRVSPEDAVNMPKLVLRGEPGTGVLNFANNAHHYRFIGIEVKPADGHAVNGLIRIGLNNLAPATLPNHIVIDRCYVHGDLTAGSRRGIAMNGAYVAVVDSYLSTFFMPGADSQAIWAHNTTGPLRIVNNYLEGASENVLFGGADSLAPTLVPSDIEIRRNHFFKPLSWIGQTRQVKNHLELKSAKRVVVAENIFENVWPAPDGQAGWSILVSPRNQDGGAPWSVTEDVSIRGNRFLNVAQGIRVGGEDGDQQSERTHRVLIENNLVSITGLNGASGRLFGIQQGPADVTINHNTGLILGGTDSVFASVDLLPKTDGFAFTNNIVDHGQYGFKGSGVAEGLPTLNVFFVDFVFSRNAIIGAAAGAYPPDNFLPESAAAAHFTDYKGRDFRLAPSSPYRNAGLDGKDLGADMDLIPRLGPKPGTPIDLDAR
ncbi:MAG: hypothetical protein ABI640_05090 [Gammaproteobacteria bacterium]